MRIHLASTREKSIQCDICLKRFGRKNEIRKHMLIHSGTEKRSKCDSSHNENREFHCDIVSEDMQIDQWPKTTFSS